MKRWIPKIAICLLLGLITTVAITWGLAAWVSTSNANLVASYKFVQDLDWMSGWRIYHSQSFGSERIMAMARKTIPSITQQAQGAIYLNTDELEPWWSNLSEVMAEQVQTARDIEAKQKAQGDNSRVSPTVVYDDARGWPLVAFLSHWDSGMVPGGPKDDKQLSSGIELSPASPKFPGVVSIDDQRALPYKPIWLGLVVDILFYTLIWFTLIFVYEITNRALRRNKGCCIKCGYDLRGIDNEGCPECGWGREDEA